jgi:hypothetical protein
LISGCQQSETALQKETTKTVASATTLSKPTAGASCLVAIQGLDIEKQVKIDIDQGETRFFILSSQEPPAHVAPGIRHCLYSQWKTTRPNEVAGFPLSGSSLLQKCDAAIVNYMIDYNRILAEKFTDSTKLNCIGGKGKADEKYSR